MIFTAQAHRCCPIPLRASLVLLASLEWGVAPSLAFPTCDTLATASAPVAGQRGVVNPVENPPVQAPDCWISPAQAAQQRVTGQTLWVDVRPVASRRQSPLQGALEISLAELPDRAFLRTQPVVLVGTGWDSRALASACLQLRQAGFRNLALLSEGVQAWRASGGQGGPSNTTPGWQDIEPGDAHEALAARPWRVITVGVEAPALTEVPGEQLIRALPWPVSASVLQSALQAAQAVPAPPSATPVAGARPTRTSTPKAHPVTPESAHVLLIPADAQIAQGLAVILAELPPASESTPKGAPATHYWLSTGWADYLRRSQDARRIAQNAGRPLTRPCSAL